jgi:hypothetical protein
MKVSLLILAALAAIACNSDNPEEKATLSEGAVGQVAGAPAVAPPPPVAVSPSCATALEGRVDNQAADERAAVQLSGMRVRGPSSLSDPFQYINTATAAPSMVIRTGQAFIEVGKIDPAILKIRELAAQVGGYITNSSISGGKDQIRQATLEVKIPAPKYDEAVGSLSTIGKVETVNSQAQDVGEEFVDVTARVTNARRLEERLITLLANRTGKLDEVLRVERELARVREEIERYEGRLRYLGARVATSTLTITVHEPAPIIGNSPGENPIASALRRAWRNFVALIAGIIASLGVLIPLGLLGFACWAGYRRWKVRNR